MKHREIEAAERKKKRESVGKMLTLDDLLGMDD